MPSKTILVVDDEDGVRDLFKHVLSSEGYLVECAANGQQAIAKAREHPYDLYIIDLKMPGIDGCETHDRIKRLYPDTKALLIAAYILPKTTQEIKERGFLGCIHKPSRVNEIVLEVENALKEHA